MNAAAPKPHFAGAWVSDATVDFGARPILKGLVEPGAFVVIYGPSGSGKSFFTADICQHIATGAQWRGHRVSQGLVVYVASEAGSSILKRFVGWRDNRLGESAGRVPLYILTRGPNLLAGTDVEKLCEQLALLQTEAGIPLALVVFDTLSRSIPGGDENSAEDMTMAVSAADYLREKFKCATAYVHHSGKDITKGARGHSALFAAADLVISVADGCATVEKIRDGVANEKFPFALTPIEIGTDADGDPVMTCLLEHTDAARAKRKPRPTGRIQKLVLGELERLVADSGQILPATSQIPAGTRAVRYDALVDRCAAKMPGIKPFTARQRVSDALVALQDGHVGTQGDWIWLA